MNANFQPFGAKVNLRLNRKRKQKSIKGFGCQAAGKKRVLKLP
jgi:hypothetical protein